jgi:hypothetical protein
LIVRLKRHLSKTKANVHGVEILAPYFLFALNDDLFDEFARAGSRS